MQQTNLCLHHIEKRNILPAYTAPLTSSHHQATRFFVPIDRHSIHQSNPTALYLDSNKHLQLRLFPEKTNNREHFDSSPTDQPIPHWHLLPRHIGVTKGLNLLRNIQISNWNLPFSTQEPFQSSQFLVWWGCRNYACKHSPKITFIESTNFFCRFCVFGQSMWHEPGVGKIFGKVRGHTLLQTLPTTYAICFGTLGGPFRWSNPTGDHDKISFKYLISITKSSF